MIFEKRRGVFEKLFVCVFVSIFFSFSVFASADLRSVLEQDNLSVDEDRLVVDFFWSSSCGHCAKEKPFLQELADKYDFIDLRMYEVHDSSNYEFLKQRAEQFGFDVRGVPVTVVGHRYWIGYSNSIKKEISSCVAGFEQKLCSPVLNQSNDSVVDSSKNFVDLPFVGKVDVDESDMSVVVFTVLISFIDGFNPCSLWVLMFLLSMAIYTKSRKKIFVIGSTFLFVTAFCYGVFMLGVFRVMSLIESDLFIRVLVAFVAFVFGVVNVKDFFWFKKGISFTISDRYKPKLFKKVRGIVRSKESLFSVFVATFVMALGITLVELPCTMQLPMMWVSFMQTHAVSGFLFWLLFVIYMLIYLFDEILFFVVVIVTLRASRFDEKHGKVLKLVSGVIMLSLGVVLLVNPNLMNSIYGTLKVFAGAFVVVGVVVGLSKLFRPERSKR